MITNRKAANIVNSMNVNALSTLNRALLLELCWLVSTSLSSAESVAKEMAT
jgi:hypothetical protein